MTVKVLPHRSDENEQNRSQVNTKLFRSLLEVAHTNEDTSSIKRWKERNVIVLLLSQLYCLKLGGCFRF